MAGTAHSLELSDVPSGTGVERTWPILLQLKAAFGGEYTVNQRAVDGSDVQHVASHDSLEFDAIPRVVEPPETWNSIAYLFWIDTSEVLLSLSRYPSFERLALVFMRDAINKPGPFWLTQCAEGLLEALALDAALLVEEGDEAQETYARRRSGEALLDIVRRRISGELEMGPILLALLSAEAATPELVEAGRARGLRVGYMPSGAVMFSSVHG